MIQTFFDKNTRESDIESITESDVCGSPGFEWMIRLRYRTVIRTKLNQANKERQQRLYAVDLLVIEMIHFLLIFYENSVLKREWQHRKERMELQSDQKALPRTTIA